MIRPIRTLPLGNTRRLWDGSDPDIGYDLRSYDADAQHARLLWQTAHQRASTFATCRRQDRGWR